MTSVLPAVALTPVGAVGGPVGVMLADGIDALLGPNILMATTVQVTAVPLVRFMTVIGEAIPFALRLPQVAV